MSPRRVWLFGAALPAIGMGIWLLRLADAPRSAQVLQVVAVVTAMLVYAAIVLWRVQGPARTPPWLSLLPTGVLFLPLLAGSHDGPVRWLALGPLRLYVAPVVVPWILFRLDAPRTERSVYIASVLAVVVALFVQPDASQLTAFAVAMTALLMFGPCPTSVRVSLLTLVLGAAAVAWRTPEPLAPVRYVEGVFAVAATESAWMLGAALVVAFLPVATFAWVARILRSPGSFAVALYWAALFALAPWQTTPVPWLGFGAGPILGYFLVAGAISRAIPIAADSRSTTRVAMMSRFG